MTITHTITGKLLPVHATDADIERCAKSYRRFILMRRYERRERQWLWGGTVTIAQQVTLDAHCGIY